MMAERRSLFLFFSSRRGASRDDAPAAAVAAAVHSVNNVSGSKCDEPVVRGPELTGGILSYGKGGIGVDWVGCLCGGFG